MMPVTRHTLLYLMLALPHDDKAACAFRQNNYVNGVFLLGRVFDKLVFSALTVIYYWKVGRDFSAVNVPNIAGVLFLWCVAPVLRCRSAISQRTFHLSVSQGCPGLK